MISNANFVRGSNDRPVSFFCLLTIHGALCNTRTLKVLFENFLADHPADHAANEPGNQKKGERICRDIAHNGICILLSITAD